MKDYIPKWHRELEIFDSIMPVIVLEGNVLDKYQYPVDGSIQKGSIVKLTEYLHYFFKDAGYSSIVFYDAIRGFYNQCEDGYLDRFARNTGLRMDKGFVKADFKGHTSQAAIAIQQTLSQNQEASVVILDFASRYISNPTNMEQSEIDAYTILQQASLDAKDIRTENGILKNLMVFLVNKANDLPAWFFLDNPNVKIIKLSNPSKEEREALIKGMNFQTFFDGKVYAAESGYYEEHPDELEQIQDRFVALTEGFSFTELNGLRRLCKKQCEHIKDMCSVIDLYKFGVKENPWDAISYVESIIKCRRNRYGFSCIIFLSEGRRKEVKTLNGYSYLTLEQRREIERMYAEGERVVDIAARLKRSAAAIYEELKRGYTGEFDGYARPKYSADLAQATVQENFRRRGNRRGANC